MDRSATAPGPEVISSSTLEVYSALAGVSCPALVVHGSEDPIPAESSREIAAALGARFVLLEGSGHVPYVERPDLLFPALTDFLDETDA